MMPLLEHLQLGLQKPVRLFLIVNTYCLGINRAGRSRSPRLLPDFSVLLKYTLIRPIKVMLAVLAMKKKWKNARAAAGLVRIFHVLGERELKGAGLPVLTRRSSFLLNHTLINMLICRKAYR
jgi:hypothetical protein